MQWMEKAAGLGTGAASTIEQTVMDAKRSAPATRALIQQEPASEKAAPEEQANSKTLPQAALAYASAGLPVFPLRPGTKKPLTNHGFKDATRDADRIRQWWAAHPEANIGIATGQGSGLVVLDVDIKSAKPGEQSWRKLKGQYDLPDTLESRTPSGGSHYIYVLPEGCPPIASRTDFPLPGIDIRSDGGYIVAPPSAVDGKAYEWVRFQAPVILPQAIVGRLAETAHVRKVSGAGNDRVITELKARTLYKRDLGGGKHEITCPWVAEHTDQVDNGAAYFVPSEQFPDGGFKCHHAHCAGSTIRDVLAFLKIDPDTPIWVVDAIVAEMNAKHAVVTVGGQTLILTEVRNALEHPDITLGRPADLETLYANRTIRRSKKNLSIAKVWLSSPARRTYHGIVFDPSGQADSCLYNLWRGFAVKPKKGDCQRFLKHIDENIAQGDERIYHYILAWMADCMQNPTRRPGVALVLRGKEGTGKGILAKWFGALFGPHYLHISHARHLTGYFNAHLKDKLIVFADEAFWAGDKAAEGPLKALITEHLIQIEPKGRDPFAVRNCLRVIIATNNEWAVPAGLEARRFAVFDVGEAHMQDRKYFAAIEQEMQNGGLEALLDYLLNFDLTGIDLGDFPKTAALLEQKLHTMSPIDKFWFEVLQRGTLRPGDEGWTGWVPKDTLHQEYQERAQQAGKSHRAAQTELGTALQKLVPGLRCDRKKDIDLNVWKADLNGSQPKWKRVRVWEFPPLAECRAAFEEALGQPIAWEVEDDRGA